MASHHASLKPLSEPRAADPEEQGMAAIDLKMLSALAVREAYRELIPQFERANGRTVAITWAGAVDILKRLTAGEIYDLVVASKGAIDDLVTLGKIAPAGVLDVARSGIGVAVRQGAKRPNIGSAEALKRAVMEATTVGYSTGPSGVYLAGLFERMGIVGDVKAKLRSVPSGGTIGAIVASGEAEIGFQQISELVHARGIDFIGPLPDEVQYITVITAGIPTAAKDPAAAGALATFLAGPSAKAVLERAGLQTA
jgi:molybdate transport system substrate-binding protein